MKLTPLAAALAALLSTSFQCAYALEIRTVDNHQGRTVFEARFFDIGDGPYMEKSTSSWPWVPRYKDHIMRGLQYWAEIIQPKGDNPPTIINIGTDSVKDNAFGGSPLTDAGKGEYSLVQQNMQGFKVKPQDLDRGAHGYFGLGPSDYPEHYTVSQTLVSGKGDLFNTAIHEIAHGMGLTNTVDDVDYIRPHFGATLDTWAKLLIDDNGQPARAGQSILCQGCLNPYDPQAFDARRDDVYLVGPNISQVMAGAMPGVPVKMLRGADNDKSVDTDYMSHIELRNSMMSHQNYRNYTGFMEAELAVLQDLGYTIDRANFFGRSVYGDRLDLVNNQGFFARNAAGTQYLPGQHNLATLGLGLHVYGSHNRVRQVADLLATGAGGTGIRVDGESNTIVVDPGVRLHGNGSHGRGIQFAYGRNHTLVHRGDMEALGADGVGLLFDFGTNAMDDREESRGSWIRTLNNKPATLLPELQGPLVGQADITGRIAGRDAAIHISNNAYVGQINLMQGTRLEGDVVSHYGERDPLGQLRLTTLSFGQKADAQGRATGIPDPGFRLSHSGNIRGVNNLTLTFDGGETRLNGQHEIHGAWVQSAARLSGASRFDLAPGTALVNAGTVAPGNSIGRITVHGDYRQAATGRLLAEFTSQGAHDVLAVTGQVDLAGALELAALPGWYGNAWVTDTGSVVESPTIRGAFTRVTTSRISPTIDFAATPLGAQRWRLSATRAHNAYTRYAHDASTRAVGQMFDQMAAAGASASQPFLGALDFSAADGSDVARTLSQASPAAYGALLSATLQRERDTMHAARLGLEQQLGARHADRDGFALIFGGDSSQSARGSLLGYAASSHGLVLGGGTTLEINPDLAAGLYLDLQEQSVSLDSPLSAKGKSSAWGLGALLQYRPNALSGWHAHGAVRHGLAHTIMERSISVGGYRTTHKADWTSHASSLGAGAGYLWQFAPALSVGPFLALDYAQVKRPELDESGDLATRLHLERQNFGALRSSLGAAAVWQRRLEDGSNLSGRGDIRWEREHLNRDVVQATRFSVLPEQPFDSIQAVLPRHSMALGASLAWQRSKHLSVGFDLNGRFGEGYKAVDGRLNLRWTF